MRIGTAYIDSQRDAASIGQQGSLDTEFPAIRRVFPGFFPHPVATWLSPRPCFATPTGYPLVHRIPVVTFSKVCEKPPVGSTPENRYVTRCPSHTHAVQLSIGSRYAKYKRYPRRFASLANADARLCGLRGILAITGTYDPTMRPEDTKHKKYVPSTFFSPPCEAWIKQSVSSIRREVGMCSVFG